MHLVNSLILLIGSTTLTSVSAWRCRDSLLPAQGNEDSPPWKCKDANATEVCGNLDFQTHCPDLCGTCDEMMCMDSAAALDKAISCEHLALAAPDFKEQKCQNKKWAKTCRKTCGFCEQTMHFDKLGIGEKGYRMLYKYKNPDFWIDSGVLFDPEVIFGTVGTESFNYPSYYYHSYDYYYRGYYDGDDFFNDYEYPLPISEPNALGMAVDEIYFGCNGGSFDLLSLHTAPLWRFNLNSTLAVLGWAEDASGNVTITSEKYIFASSIFYDSFIDFTEPDTFQYGNFTDLAGIVLYGYGSTWSFDDIEVKVTNPCSLSDGMDAKALIPDAKAHLLSGVAKHVASPPRSSKGLNLWEKRGGGSESE